MGTLQHWPSALAGVYSSSYGNAKYFVQSMLIGLLRVKPRRFANQGCLLSQARYVVGFIAGGLSLQPADDRIVIPPNRGTFLYGTGALVKTQGRVSPVSSSHLVVWIQGRWIPRVFRLVFPSPLLLPSTTSATMGGGPPKETLLCTLSPRRESARWPPMMASLLTLYTPVQVSSRSRSRRRSPVR